MATAHHGTRGIDDEIQKLWCYWMCSPCSYVGNKHRLGRRANNHMVLVLRMSPLALRLAILELETPHYVHLDLLELCDELRASKTAIRAAMKELELEGFHEIEQES